MLYPACVVFGFFNSSRLLSGSCSFVVCDSHWPPNFGLLQWVEQRIYIGSTVLMAHDSMFFCTLSSLSSSLFSSWSVLQQYVVSIDGNDPFIKWQMERGLDWTISSVTGESYRVDVSRAVWSLCHFYFCSVIICWLRSVLFFFLMPDWLDWTTGELRSKKPPHHNWWTNKSHTCVERHLLHPQILFRCPLWLPTLVWFQQKSI